MLDGNQLASRSGRCASTLTGPIALYLRATPGPSVPTPTQFSVQHFSPHGYLCRANIIQQAVKGGLVTAQKEAKVKWAVVREVRRHTDPYTRLGVLQAMYK